MADNLIFPIGFDLQKAVEKAGQDWDKTYAKKLESYLAKRPIKVKLNFENLTDVKTRLAQLKIEPITPETKAAIKQLANELQQLAKALEQVQKYSRNPSKRAVDASRVQLNEQRAKAQAALAAQRAAKAEDDLAAARLKAARAANVGTSATRNANKAFAEQTTYLQRLTQSMMAYWSVRQVGNFLTNVREVTAQFELQRVSLGAILQDQNKANKLFSEIKSFALNSPVKILDLTKYTKQLAAYKIGYDELFETTKKLTDVSVGLGVSMDRVILAYGQVRATGYLRASEVRQFTEMGVPIVEELAEKLSKLNGEAVTTADVMELISKRGISFEMVKDVFNDLTSAGGIFYNMQEKQGNTLYGMWAKLGDAASVMYEQIGNTNYVDSAMKGTIQLLTDLMRNWEAAGMAMAVAVSWLGAIKVYRQILTQSNTAQIAAVSTTKAREAAIVQLSKAIEKGAVDDINAANATLQKARADEQAAISATKKATILKNKLALLGNTLATGLGIGAVIALVMSLVYDLTKAWNEAHKLKNELNDIATENMAMQAQQVRQFEFLADKAINVALSDKERNEALQELHRTFKDAIPIENMSVENLQRMAESATDATHKYTKLTDALKEYIAEQNRQKAISAIQAELQPKINKELGKMREVMDKHGYGAAEQAKFVSEIITVFSDPDKIGRPLHDNVVEALRNAGIDGGDELADRLIKGSGWDRLVRAGNKIGFGAMGALGLDPDKYAWIGNLPIGIMNWTADTEKHVDSFAESMEKMNALTEEQNRNYKEQTKDLGVYKDEWERVQKAIADSQKYASDDTDEFLVSQENKNNRIKAYISTLQIQMGTYWDSSFATIEETVGESGEKMSQIFFDKFNDPKWLAQLPVDLQKYITTVQNAYYDLEPEDNLINAINRKFMSLAIGTKANMAKMTKYLLNGDDKIKDKLNQLTSSLDDVNAKIYQYEQTNEKVKRGKLGISALVSQEKIDELKNESKALALFIELLQGLVAPKDTGGDRTSDPRLQNLKEEISLTKKLYDEYQKLEKQIGATKAAEKIQQIYSNTIKTLEDRAQKYGFEFELPFTDENMKANMQHFIDKMKELQKLRDKKGKPLFPNIGKEIDEAVAQLEDVDFNSLQRALEKKLKELADRISRTKTAKELFDKILEQTGDINVATRVSMSIYGSTGDELFNDTVEQIREAFKTGSEEHPIDLDISAAIDLENQRIDYKKLADIYDKYQDEIIEKRRDTAKKIAAEGQKEVATDILNWRKSLAQAKSYEQQRTDIINKASAERAKIIRETTDPKERGELLGLSYSKQAQDLAKLAVDEFKSSDDYIKVFQDLDRVSTQTLERMKKRLEEMIETVKGTENVEGLKSLVEQLDKINEEKETRNPIEGIIESFKEYAKARKDYRTAEAEEAKARAEFAQQEFGLNMAIQIAKNEQAIAQQRVNDLEEQGKLNTNEGVAAQLALNEATKKVTQATEKRNKAVEKVNKAEQNTTDAIDAQKEAIAKLSKNVNAMANAFSSAASSIQTIADMMGVAEDSELGDIVNGLVSGLNNAATIMTTILAIAIAIEAACWWLLAVGAVVSVFSAIGSWLAGSKVRKANKEIERQQKLLDQLDYTYGRLEKAADKLFGSDYVNNYQQQIENLQAQQQAYLKQAAAERSKGKKEDKKKTKEYEKQARETADKIKELQDDLVAHFTGSSKTDVARQMAKSWIDARASMSDTFAAIKGDYQDLIKNMIVEGAAARVIENALSPLWEQIEDAYKSNNPEEALDKALQGMDVFLNNANDGMEVLWKALEARGYDMKKLISDTDSEYTGIAKSVSSATSEEINANTAALNTQNYYMSFMPQVAEHVAAMRQLMERGTASAIPAATSTGWTDWQQQAMDNYMAIARNTAETVVRCERAAVACEAFAADIHRIIKVKGATQGINVFLNS